MYCDGNKYVTFQFSIDYYTPLILIETMQGIRDLLENSKINLPAMDLSKMIVYVVQFKAEKAPAVFSTDPTNRQHDKVQAVMASGTALIVLMPKTVGPIVRYIEALAAKGDSFWY